MISRVSGTIRSVSDGELQIEVGGFDYQVLVPEFVRRQLQEKVGSATSLFTIHYMEGNPAQGRLSPRLVGFQTEVEREFFELFCSVDGVGVRKALRAMVRPVREVAASIEDQDVKALATLPGIGPATAERIVAKLRRKMPKFALLVDRTGKQTVADVAADVIETTFGVLRQLGHSESDARKLLDSVLQTKKKKYKDVESLLADVYQTSRGEDPNP